MDKCEIHPHCFKQGDTPCPACVSQAALDKVKVASRKMTMTEERMIRINSARLQEIHSLEDRLTSSEVWRRIYAVAAVAGWVCLVLYSAFGGPEL